jgi:tRNA threonylcarbamoyladenosine biosynthesis protein TsaB
MEGLGVTGRPGPVVLSLDSAGLGCSIAVAVGDRLLLTQRVDTMHAQAEMLLPMAASAMKAAGLLPTAIDFVVTTVGPGSFTGIRVGIAAARGIALGADARLIGVTSFEAVAAAFHPEDGGEKEVLLIALESRRDDLYIQLFDPLRNSVGEPSAIRPVRLGCLVEATIGKHPLVIAGDAAQRAGRALSGRSNKVILEGSAPDAVGAWRAVLRGKTRGTLRPVYLRPPDVTLDAGHRPVELRRA